MKVLPQLPAHVVILIALLYSGTAYAQQEGTLAGKVITTNSRPIPFATVNIKNTTLGTVSRDDGSFSLKLPAGEYTAIASSIQYKKMEKKVVVKPHSTTKYDFVLTENDLFIDEIVIHGKGEAQEMREMAMPLNVVEMKSLSNNSANINQVLNRSTGVTIRESGGVGSDFAFKINGLDAKIFIDGIPMESFGSSMTLNNIPVNLVERVEVYKGVVPANLASDALGGAVNIITKRKNQRFLDVSYSYGSFNTHQASLIGTITSPKNGLTLKLNSFYNYSDNDYTMYTSKDYDVILEKVENGKYVEVDKVKRFYDQYSSAMGKIELGFEDRVWADRLLLGFLYSGNKKQNQLGATINTVNGGQWSESRYYMPTLNYRNEFLGHQIFTDLYASYSRNKVNIRDTATYNYDWSGGWITSTADNNAETLDEEYTRNIYKNYLVRTNFTYYIDQQRQQTLTLSYNFNSTKQDSYDMMEDEKTNLPGKLSTHIAGLSWQGEWFDKKLVSLLSAKYYGIDTYKSVDERAYSSNNEVISGAINTYNKFMDFVSGNFALRYRFLKDLGIKLSFEKAYKFPTMIALFGDGQDYLANWDIEPEASNNFNFGGFYNTYINRNNFINIDIGSFYRKAENYLNTQIITQDKKDYYQYYNVPGVKLYGVEADIKYAYKDLVQLSVNGSYEKALDNKKYTDETNSKISITYDYQLPNRPWIYGNADLTFAKEDLLGSDSRIQLTWQYHYVHWYYLSWEHLGTKSSKAYIPTQTVQSAIIGYSWKNNKYNVSFEARNLTNELVYDNFRLQKPGRAFYLKFRLSLM